MIRRNTAGQVIYLPQLTTLDGTPITSSATLTVAKDGSESASAGTLAHSDNGVWKYTPTQGETDAAIVGLILTGTSAVPVVLNLVTTAANTQAAAFGANTVAPDNAGVAAIKVKTDQMVFSETNSLDVNVKYYNGTLQSNGDLPLKMDAVKSDTGDIRSRLPAALVDGKMDSNATVDLTEITDQLDVIQEKTNLIGTGDALIPTRLKRGLITLYIGEQHVFTLPTSDYLSRSVKLQFEQLDGTVIAIANSSLTKTSNTVAFTIPEAVTENVGKLDWALKDTTTDEVLQFGVVSVEKTANV